MSIKKIVLGSALATLLFAGTVSAQAAGGVNVSTTPFTGSVSSGTGVNLGTITLTGVNGGATVTSLPITITGSNGGVASNLSNCQVYNASGVSLTTGSNVVGQIGTGANSFTFNAPLSVSGTGTTVPLTVRCDVATSTPSGAMFTIAAGSAVLQTTQALRVNLDTAPSVPAGSQDVTLANISLSGTGGLNYNVTSIPLTITAGSGGSTANLTGCVIRHAGNLDLVLSNNPTVVNGAATTFNLTVPLAVVSGSAPMLALTCDVQPATPVGSTFTIAVTPGNVAATNAANGQSVTPIALTGTGPNGLPAATSGTVIVSAAGSGSGSGSGSGTGSGSGIPGVPNTGMGDSLILALALAGAVMVGGSLYLSRRAA